MEVIYLGDHDPTAPLTTSTVLMAVAQSTMLLLNNDY